MEFLKGFLKHHFKLAIGGAVFALLPIFMVIFAIAAPINAISNLLSFSDEVITTSNGVTPDIQKKYDLTYCNDDDPDCNKDRDDQTKFYDELKKAITDYNLTEEQKYLILTTIFLGIDYTNFNTTSGIIGVAEGELDTSEDSDFASISEDIYKEETSSIKELAKQFRTYGLVCVNSETNEKYNLKDPNGNEYSFSYIEFVKYNINPEWLEGYNEAVNSCNGNVTRTSTTSTDKYYKYLEESTYFDKREQYNDYYINYARSNNLDSSNISSWSEEDKKEVRLKIIEEIKEQVNNKLNEEKETTTEPEYIAIEENEKFWWPIGSVETTTSNGKNFATGAPYSVNITSPFGWRIHPVYGTRKHHNGIDIGVGGVVNKYSVIASKSGVVVQAINTCKQGNMKCGGGFGNYVTISHDGNISTIYAHLAEGSVTVKIGETVMQGQVIGKVGSTGSSTGAHLHFSVKSGMYLNPMDFVSDTDPRPQSYKSSTTTSSTSKFIEMLSSYEGGPTDGNGNYRVVCNKGDVPTVGHGVTLTYDTEYFAKYGINLKKPYTDYCKTTMPIDTIDKIYYEVVDNHMSQVKKTLTKNKITLKQNQIEALTSLHYNAGNIVGFVDAYNRYGSNQALCDNWFIGKQSGGIYSTGLKKRRKAECNLFVNGVYTLNS